MADKNHKKNKILFFDLQNTLFFEGELRKGVKTLLQKAKKEYFIAAVSDMSSSIIDEYLKKHNIRQHFDIIISSRDYDTLKPDPLLINVAVIELKDKYETDIDMKNSYIVGDRPDKDIRLGNLTGIKTIRILDGPYKTSQPDGKLEIPDYNIKTITELNNIIFKKGD